MRCTSVALALLLSTALATLDLAAAEPLPGLTIDGHTWKLEREGSVTEGILVKPEGDGPFPAVLISHGLGGNARGFALPKARELARRGFICIATDYTHSQGRGGDRSTFGANPENIRRARLCIDVLRSLPDVNSKRIYAYGNSMGAFLTIGLAADAPDLIAAAAITAGGIAPQPGFPAPTTQTATKVKAPMLILHGTTDTTVRPELSAALEKVLADQKVPHKRQLFEGIGHNLHQQKSDEVLDAIVAWFNQHGAAK